jgi:phosphatidyl-myo-inositol dimannoside synthase
MRHILLTNDFPPKVGGIQSYLWELWRRLPPDDVTVFTASHLGAEWWDREQKYRVVRAKEPVLLPQPHLASRIKQLAAVSGAEAVVIDPALPLGLIGPSLGLPYAVVLHGAEVTVPGRLPVSQRLLGRVLKNASMVIAAGQYPEAEARRALRNEKGADGSEAEEVFPPSVQIPPGVDTQVFKPLPQIERAAARVRFRLPASGPLVSSVSRLVPRKGMDTLIQAASVVSTRLPGLSVAIAGAGRDRHRLERLASHANVRVDFLGRLSAADLPDFYACSDVFALCCRSRWWGLEQEGFGIVLVEAAATGVPCVTIDTGGAAEAVRDGETGLVVRSVPDEDPPDRSAGHSLRRSSRHGPGNSHAPGSSTERVAGVAEALATILDNPVLARHMGEAGRRRAEEELSYDILAAKLGDAIDHYLRRPQGR